MTRAGRVQLRPHFGDRRSGCSPSVPKIRWFGRCAVGTSWHVWKKVEIEVDSDLVREVVSRHRLAGAREAVHLALRTLLGETHGAAGEPTDDEYDEFSDLSAWQPGPRHETG